jgi:peptidoglycan/xylan/chitin deacetylase (PgdA/CDA1 family)
VQAAQDTLTNITGQRPLFFRAPAGLRNVFLDPVLTQLGLRLATWSVRGFDTQVGDTQQVKNKLLAGLHPGGILLMHDGNSAFTPQGNPIIVEVLPSLLAAAKARDLHFVTLQQAVS